jgi:hypothetical protein
MVVTNQPKKYIGGPKNVVISINHIYTGAESTGPRFFLLVTLFVISFVLVYVDFTQTRALFYDRLKVTYYF